jgi:hypothetical protein
VDGFSTFCSTFVDGKAQVYPGMEESARDGQAEKNLTLEEQWQRELFAKGMFENAQRGSCTSSAIYMNGCMRALGIPTRIVLAIPIIDTSDERELKMISRITHNGVRRIIERSSSGSLSKSWRSHTFNEVFVGGRWRRLNYEKLGQNILDRGLFGMIIHVATFADWADGNMAATWGMRQAHPDRPGDPFGGSNPYSTLSISDQFGEHASIENPPPVEDFQVLTIDAAWWYDECPAEVKMRLDDLETAGHVVVHVEEGRPGEGPDQYKPFYDSVDKAFVLRAAGQPDVRIHATRGYWGAPDKGLQHFYLRIEPDVYAKMATDVPYTLDVVDKKSEMHWAVHDGITLTKSKERAARLASAESADRAANESTEPPTMAERPPLNDQSKEVLLDWVVWSDASNSPTRIPSLPKPVLLARAGTKDDFDAIKKFTENADLRFFLEADGHPTLKVGAMIGGVTTREHSYIMITLGPADWRDLVPGLEYTVRAQNAKEGYRWEFARPLKAKR